MSKATPAQLQEEGFKEPSQFGQAAGAGYTTYLQVPLDFAAGWAASRLGATAYAAATGGNFAELATIRAELAKAKAILFRRRVGFLDASAGAGAQEGRENDRAEMLRHAEAAEVEAEGFIAEAMRASGISALDASGGASVGHVETGPYPVASTAALNA